MAIQFQIGDDGSVTWGGTEVDSLESVSFNKSRSLIESRDRSSDNVHHRTGKDARTASFEGVVKPGDAGLAAMASDYDSNSENTCVVTRDTGDELANANYVISDLNEDQPLEEGQSFSVEIAYHSATGS